MTRSIHLDTPFGTEWPTTPIVINVQFAGQRFSIPLTSLDIGTATTDAKVKRAVATRLLVTPDRLDGHVVDRHDSGELTLRPEPWDIEPAPDESPGPFSFDRHLAIVPAKPFRSDHQQFVPRVTNY